MTRRAKNYLMHDDKLFRLFDSGERKEVPPPHARAEIVRYMHEQHGHFGSRRTVNLMYPNFFWANMGRDVKEFVSRCSLCDSQHHLQCYCQAAEFFADTWVIL